MREQSVCAAPLSIYSCVQAIQHTDPCALTPGAKHETNASLIRTYREGSLLPWPWRRGWDGAELPEDGTNSVPFTAVLSLGGVKVDGEKCAACAPSLNPPVLSPGPGCWRLWFRLLGYKWDFSSY